MSTWLLGAISGLSKSVISTHHWLVDKLETCHWAELYGELKLCTVFDFVAGFVAFITCSII